MHVEVVEDDQSLAVAATVRGALPLRAVALTYLYLSTSVCLPLPYGIYGHLFCLFSVAGLSCLFSVHTVPLAAALHASYPGRTCTYLLDCEARSGGSTMVG